MKQPMKFVCERCGSDSVETEAWVGWDTSKQTWVLNSLVCEGTDWCHDCDGETAFNYVPVTDLRTLAEYTIAKEKADDNARSNPSA